jgi:dinuclear metal center YbgI/SA1388 family protein
MIKTQPTVKEISDFLSGIAPLETQESYDNSGLLAGDILMHCPSALLCVDVTEKIMDEAIRSKIPLVISHHPFIFNGLKKITGRTECERILMKAIRSNVAVFSLHTPFDAAPGGISMALAEFLGLQNISILKPAEGQLKKIVTFVPEKYAETVRKSMFEAGAGHIGNYDSCSYNLSGEGTFRALEGSNPFTGKMGEIHREKELRIETIVPFYRAEAVIKAMKKVHPYEEVAYDVYPIENENPRSGMGAMGELPDSMEEKEFLLWLKERLQTGCVRYSPLSGRLVSKVAVCGGSGSFLIPDAIRSGAQVFVTGDMKYHQFQEAGGRIVIADPGHFESEKVFLPVIRDLLKKNFTNFAVRISKTNTNPVNYL